MGSVHKKKGKTFILKIWSWVIITGKWNPLKLVWCGTCRLVQWAVPRGCPYRPEVCRIHRGFSSWVCTTVTEIVVRENKYSQSERSGVNCPYRWPTMAPHRFFFSGANNGTAPDWVFWRGQNNGTTPDGGLRWGPNNGTGGQHRTGFWDRFLSFF